MSNHRPRHDRGALKRCLDCNALGRYGSRGRCARCYRSLKAKRYDATFDAERDRFEAQMAAGAVFDCPRCGEPIDSMGPWDLDHYGARLQPAHVRCNRGRIGGGFAS